eukprot:NODE_120_length_17920_cov_0.559782.p9 type:complete len:174 gc:universal NODE_120_length_17920_cov_0.559782:2724-2203(-)
MNTQVQDQEKPEVTVGPPKCCCLSIQQGLCILYFILLVWGIVDIYDGVEPFIDAISLTKGGMLVIAALLGTLSLIKKHEKVALGSIWAVLVLILGYLALAITKLAVVRAQVDSTIDNKIRAQPDKKDEWETSRNSWKTTATILASIGIGITLFIAALIVQRQYVYRKYLQTNK